MSQIIVTPEFLNLEAPPLLRVILEHIIANADIVGADVGGGLSVASVESGNVDELTWHAEVGTAINIYSRFALVPSYRYVGVEPRRGVTDDVLTIQRFRLGARVSFS